MYSFLGYKTFIVFLKGKEASVPMYFMPILIIITIAIIIIMTIIIYHNVFLKEKALQNLRENERYCYPKIE